MLVRNSENPSASVVLPSYNAAHTVPMVLEALVAQVTDLRYEVILVESSGDGTAEIVRSLFPEVQVIESPRRLFPGAARDLGAERAKGRILLFLDADCVPESDWLDRMWATHERYDCAVVAGSILNGNPRFATSVSSYMNEFSDFFPYGEPRYVDYLPSGNTSYKIEIFRRHGGFDPNEPMYEDLIFNKLLFRAGEKLLFNPEIRVAHHHRTDLREYLGHEFRRGRGAAVARRRGLMVGAIWARKPALGFLAAPGLFMRKAAVFPYRLLRAYPNSIFRLLRALPCFYLALLVWHCGFLADIASGGKIGNTREGTAKCTIN
jgi:GT2 family glycosyltransferase